MVYRVIGLMSGSSLDGLDIAFVELHENAGKWTYEVINAGCYSYPTAWVKKLSGAVHLSALDYQLLHTEYGHYLGQEVNRFVDENGLHYKVALIASHGHTTFHLPSKKMTAQLGDGSAIAAATSLPVVSDLRALDIALGGQGAPIVPIGEKLLLGNYDSYLNLGGIANISFAGGNAGLASGFIAFDICPANKVLDLLSSDEGKDFDQNGEMASTGIIQEELLRSLNGLSYYDQPSPKSLANDFGIDVVYPMLKAAKIQTKDALRTYVEHIAVQVKRAVANTGRTPDAGSKLLVTGGGAFNGFLIEQLRKHLVTLNVEIIIPDENLIKYKEAIIMALIGVLRWRQEYNVMASVTGAARDSIGGALWNGQEA